MDVHQRIEQAAGLLNGARRVLVLTGAGISAESGIPTFREAQTGLWAQFSPQDLATPEAFAAHPERIWHWYRGRRTSIARGGVNPGHEAIARLSLVRDTTVATQNVDGLHAAAGNTDIAELHGDIWRERCTVCDRQTMRGIAVEDPDAPLPECDECGGLMRPAVIWFGEMLPAAALERAQGALQTADCVLVIGTSNQVYPAAALVEQAITSAAAVIEVNPEATPVSDDFDVAIRGRASAVLPALLRLITSEQARS